MMLQMLARHSTHAKQAAATPPAAPAASAPVLLSTAASTPAPVPPAAPAPAQQHARIQLRTMMLPKIPQTVGLAVCGALLPTMGTLTGGATEGNGASGILGKAPATFSIVPVKPFFSWSGALTATSYGHFWSLEAAERCGRQTGKDETASDKKARHAQLNESSEQPLELDYDGKARGPWA